MNGVAKVGKRSEETKDIVAFVPARGGSKSVPFKNIKDFAGKPLIYWAVLAAQLTDSISEIYVSTDSEQIKNVVESFELSKVNVIGRSPITATDTASSESAMLEFAERHSFRTIILIQATSPLLTPFDLAEAIEKYLKNGYDSMLSVVRQKRFLWADDNKKGAYTLNYDYKARPRRQDFDGYWVENGAFYITERQNLLRTGNRLNGRIGLYEMPETTYYELDQDEDWVVLESMVKMREEFYLACLTRDIKVVALDVDGVLTDGQVYVSDKEEQLLKFSRIDGKGIELLGSNAIDVWVVSAEDSPIVKKRCAKLGLGSVFLGVKNKLDCVKQLAYNNGLQREQICFIGDDVQDLELLKWVGFSAAPSNAVDDVKRVVRYVCRNSGGTGAVREVVDLILGFKKGDGSEGY
jgi:N-acylneuraminate cytidylyltransferase